MSSLEIEVPGHLTSKSNARGHWIHAHRIAKKQRATVAGLVAMKLGAAFDRELLGMKVDRKTGRRELKTRIRLKSPWAERLAAGLVVTFTRRAPRRLDSDDNLRDAFKSVKDGVAEALVAWRYAPQEISSPSSYVVRIEWKEEAGQCR